MTRDEAAKLARSVLDGQRRSMKLLCDYILSGDYKREIERQAFETAQPVSRSDLCKAIGNVLDHWEGLPNDLISMLEEEATAFVAAMRQLNAARLATTPAKE